LSGRLAIRIPWRQVIWITAVSLPLVAIGAVLWGSTRDLSRYQARLVDQVRRATGREITARVPLSVHLGREPTLVAEGVTLSNAPWGSRPALAQVRKLTLYIQPSSLLLGEIKIGRIVVEGADILVERNEAGDSNLDMLPPPDGSGPRPEQNRSLRATPNPAFPWIDTIEVRDSLLTLAEGGGRQPLVLEVPTATFKSSASGQPLQMQATFGAPHAAAFALSGPIGSFESWIRGLPGTIDVQGSLGDGRIAIKGSVVAKGTTLQVTSEGADIAAFGPYLQLPLPRGGPYALTAKALTQHSSFKVEVPSLKVGNSELTGDVLFRVDRSGTPTVAVNVDASKLDLAGLHAPPPRNVDPQPAAPARFLPGVPFSATWLGRSALTLNARVGEVTGLTDKVQNGSVTLTSGEKRFTFRGAASFGSGSAGFDLVYDPAGRYGQATLTGTVSRVNLADLGTLLGLDLGLKDTLGDIDLRLRGAGRSARDALNASSGTIEVSATKGTWPRDSIAGFPPETQRLLGGNGDGPVPFNCLAGSFEVRAGVANLRRLVVDTPRAVVVGGGYLSLRNEGWEFILEPEARDTQGVSLASPLRIKGGTGRQTGGALEPGLGKLLIGGGPIPSLTGTFNQIARQPNIINACATMAPRVDGMRPGLRGQLPTPVAPAARRPAQPQGAR
jgi:uncharacterized protein involved in outer membrane biogenesis